MSNSFQFHILAFLFCFLWYSSATAQLIESNTKQITLLDNWQVYDQEAEVNVPFMQGYHKNQRSIFQDVNLSAYDSFYILLKMNTAGSLFLGDKLIKTKTLVPDTLIIPVSTMLSYANDSSYNRITFYSLANTDWKPPTLQVVNPKSIVKTVNTSDKDKQLFTAQRVTGGNNTTEVTFAVGLWVLFALYVYSFNKDYSLANLVSPWLIWLRYSSSDEEVSRVDTFIFFILYGLIFSFFFLNSTTTSQILTSFSDSYSPTSLELGIMLSSIIIGWLLCRFIIVKVIENLFDFKHLSTIYSRNLQWFSLGYIFLILLATSMFFFNNWEFSKGVQLFIWCTLLLKGILISITINREYRMRKVYLFSYFCTIELIPMLLGMKFFTVF